MKNFEPILKLPKKPLILLVDSSPTNLRSMGRILRNRNFEVAVAQDGLNAIKITLENRPDIILLDLVIPVMDGYEVCEKLSGDDETKDIPIIFIADNPEPENIIQAFQLGAVDFLSRSASEAEIVARIKTHLKLKNYREEIEHTNKKLTELNIELNKLNEEKNEFLGFAAHDLKNPINNISLIAKILNNDENLTREDIKGFALDITQSSERMLELIKDLLDINKIERGEFRMNKSEVNITSVLKNVVQGFAEKARVKNIKINLYHDSVDIYVNSDINAIIQILDNLISNAVKYSYQNKEIHISLASDKDFVRISIKDEGPGFTEEDMKKMFGKFARLSAQPTGDEYSTGLGLSIVKKLVDMLEGKIICNSKPGMGAEFIMEINRK